MQVTSGPAAFIRDILDKLYSYDFLCVKKKNTNKHLTGVLVKSSLQLDVVTDEWLLQSGDQVLLVADYHLKVV